ncbi:MAG: PAS domain S-box protein, partial [Deltaproteobacteria bacterium]|nr:PAS domain S-box protein [Deltaproteobacteria bacterium]
AVSDEQGRRSETVVMLCDETFRRKTEHGLNEAGDFLKKMFKTAVNGIIVTDQWGLVLRANKAIVSMLGYRLDDILGKHLSDFVPVLLADVQEEGARSEQVVGAGRAGEVRRIDTALTKEDGGLCYVTLQAAELKDQDDQVTGMVVSVQDRTVSKHAEQEQLRLNRLESISSLAGGIAGDFSGILTTILGNITCAFADIDKGLSPLDNLAHAEREALRAKEMVSQLLIFSKGGAPVKERIDLNDFLHEVAGAAVAETELSIRYEIGEHLWPLEADPAQFGQVIRSLLLNAEHAMPEGGQVTIRAENALINPAEDIALDPGSYLKIT